VQLYRYFVSQSSEFYLHNPLRYDTNEMRREDGRQRWTDKDLEGVISRLSDGDWGKQRQGLDSFSGDLARIITRLERDLIGKI
jgi:hypothetical protein